MIRMPAHESEDAGASPAGRPPQGQAPGLPQSEVQALQSGTHDNPFSVLGPHQVDGQGILRVLAPGASAVHAVLADGSEIALARQADCLYAARIDAVRPGEPRAYQLRVSHGGHDETRHDPYAFGPSIADHDLQLLSGGSWLHLADALGAHPMRLDDVDGVRFSVWAPNARRVAVVGDFNGWDGRRHGMRRRHQAGVWEIFIPGVAAGERYKFAVLGADGSQHMKADPMARAAEVSPATASVVASDEPFPWTDDDWMRTRAARQAPDAPMSVYELHVGSWVDEPGEGSLWVRLAAKLPGYARAMGFTHIEMLPVAEHPFGGSWGYQPLGLFAPTARYGTPAEFAQFVDRCHEAGLGVILDWVPAHFPNDVHGLVQFDGTALYEHADPREGYHPDWHTMVYNYGRNEVKAFLVASALEWLRRYHVDGLRVDAVASMLYRDYSRKAGEWVPNQYGGRENLEAVAFLRDLNLAVKRECPGAVTIAEESTAWPGVTASVADGGLGFDYKWNMGWMHDTLRFMAHDPIHRSHHHNDMTFGMIYAFSERFILPLSHDEVVHGKGSLLRKMPGDEAGRLANLRAYYGFMWAHPGKKLLFMGGELGQDTEWNHDAFVAWHLLDRPGHRGLQRVVADLNHLYRDLPELHKRDADPAGFAWMVGDDNANSVLAFVRTDGDRHVLAVSNFTPVARHDYRVGVPRAGAWTERFNSDAEPYGGGGQGNGGRVHTDDVRAHGQAQSLSLTLPPMSTLLLRHEG
ncbi:1,4-alpha-glucan branching protein GlgB [Bordetella genomosp. 13]|uniref:1,4-alpha-glucan branching protein GlgB n=1 Tax=Bordetella genomosp. 13 TaxID=463040 RepID=UPI0021B501BF|nr:1,4-alpha-glucan branching protein GlgB [Bordetella genomosp. 13]